MAINITRNKKNQATINLPKRRITKPKKKTKSRKAAKAKTAKTKTKSKKNNAAMAMTKSGKAKPAQKIKTQVQTSTSISSTDRTIFVFLLALIIVTSAIYVGTTVRTRNAKFAITELQKDQLKLMKEREQLMKQITSNKTPEMIQRRAKQRGMVDTTNKQ